MSDLPSAFTSAVPVACHDVPGFGGKPDLFHEVYGDATVPYTAYAPLGRVTNFDYQRAVAAGF